WNGLGRPDKTTRPTIAAPPSAYFYLDLGRRPPEVCYQAGRERTAKYPSYRMAAALVPAVVARYSGRDPTNRPRVAGID
ncbi:MAG: hypothetical protein ACRECU_01775, partial [Methylocella sp.]